MIGRALLIAAGLTTAAWGAWLLQDATPRDLWSNLLVWLAGGVLLHDAVLAPVVLVLGWSAARVVPWARGPVVVGAVLLGALTLVAVPVLGGWGRRPDNPTLLDRDYTAGWGVVAGGIVVGVVVAAAVVRSRMVETGVPEGAPERGGGDGERPGGR
ncbi:hypothetical protein [Nocardioides jensenii]|uniref:hypothetical protein n=1 Tax=Nocardioides jensenii TaxID=1843 RepID=UPI00082D14C6|nr:hypothetical protein [Nocardioides jensenii]